MGSHTNADCSVVCRAPLSFCLNLYSKSSVILHAVCQGNVPADFSKPLAPETRLCELGGLGAVPPPTPRCRAHAAYGASQSGAAPPPGSPPAPEALYCIEVNGAEHPPLCCS